MKFEEQVELLKTMSLVDEDWYTNAYPEVSSLKIDPTVHYLRYGAALGRNPSPNFDTQYFLNKYPESNEDVNPLVHFALHRGSKDFLTKPKKLDPFYNVEQIYSRLRVHNDVKVAADEMSNLLKSSAFHEELAIAFRAMAILQVLSRSEEGYRGAIENLKQAGKRSLGLQFCRDLVVIEMLCHYYLNDGAGASALYDTAGCAGQLSFEAVFIYSRTLSDNSLSEVIVSEYSKFWNSDLNSIEAIESAYLLKRIPGRSDDLSENIADLSIAEMDLFFQTRSIQGSGYPLEGQLVSILIPNFNNGDYVVRSINSALSQISVNVEVIVVDDGSTDNSWSIIKEAAAKDARVAAIPLRRNFGCYFARNVALMYARGEFVAFLDSDDLIHPKRMKRQVDLLNEKPDAVAALCQARRWSKDFKTKLNEKRFAENGLLFRRTLRDEIGFFDSVRFAGDSEFRIRIEKKYGKSSIIRHEDEFYFLRTLETSLTMSAGSEAYKVGDGEIVTVLSPNRQQYAEAFKEWHELAYQDNSDFYIPFPLRKRAFDLPSPEMNASPVLGEKVFGTMATFPARSEVLKKTLPLILQQVDKLFIYLNNYTHIPDFLAHEKIEAILGIEASGDLRDNGKFYKHHELTGFVFTFDDDIFYPTDYVQRHIVSQEMYGRRVVTGVHGVIYPQAKLGYMDGRTVLHFREKHDYRLVDSLGTGTTCFHSSLLRPKIEQFKTAGVCDLWFATLCHEAGIPLLSIERPANWLVESDRAEQGPRLYDEARASAEMTLLFHQHLFPVLANKVKDQNWGYRLESQVMHLKAAAH